MAELIARATGRSHVDADCETTAFVVVGMLRGVTIQQLLDPMIRAAQPVTGPADTDGFHMSRLGTSEESHAAPDDVRYSAGHSAACVEGVLTVAELVEQVERQFRGAEREFTSL